MNADERLSIQVTHLDGVAVLTLRGEIDGFTAPRLRESVAQAGALSVPVVLDMELVTFMDSAGISALIDASGIANGARKPVHITRPSNQVLRVLSLVGLDSVFLADRSPLSERLEPCRPDAVHGDDA